VTQAQLQEVVTRGEAIVADLKQAIAKTSDLTSTDLEVCLLKQLENSLRIHEMMLLHLRAFAPASGSGYIRIRLTFGNRIRLIFGQSMFVVFAGSVRMRHAAYVARSSWKPSAEHRA
jgi:hypothetical protein